jgi:heme exporter protein A
MAGTAAVELSGVARRFGRRWALRGVDLRVEPGEVVALRGRNGSGKTTLLRICATGLRLTRGGGRVFGFDLATAQAQVRAVTGFLAHQPGLYEDLTAAENLRFAARMLGLDADGGVVDGALARVGLEHEGDERVRGFSSGMRRRLALGRLLLAPPRLLLLDEPYASFDAEGVDLVNAFAAAVASAGGAALVATHDVARARAVAHRELHLRDGRVHEHALDADPGAGAAVAGGA